MEHPAISLIKKTIEDHALTERGMHIVVGLSGGPDSTCLFHALASLRDMLGFELSAVHVNHGLRPGDAERDARFAEALCLSHDAPFFGFTRDVNALALSQSVGTEEAGRNARYEAFFETAARVASERGLSASRVRIAVAHNMNDQAETVLMRIMRGTGPDGIAAMPYMRKSREGFAVIRPLLDVPRALIEKYCAAAGLSPARDHSNEEPVYLRNRIRLSLLPALESEYNENIAGALVRLAAAAAEDREYFDALTDKLLEESCAEEDGGISMPLAAVSETHPALRRRLLVKCFERAGLLQDIEAVHLRAADALIERGRTGKTVEFPNGYRLSLRYGRLIFFDEVKARTRSNAVSEEYRLSLCALAEGRAVCMDINTFIVEFFLQPRRQPIETLHAEQQPSDPPRSDPHDDGQQKTKAPAALEFDFDLISEKQDEIVIRSRRPGDRIRPEGLSGTKRIQDLFTDAKLPREKRDAAPLIALGNEILCVLAEGRLGRRTGDYAATSETKRVLRINILRK
jgi:tRNA(Ile)-lysidine synthase